MKNLIFDIIKKVSNEYNNPNNKKDIDINIIIPLINFCYNIFYPYIMLILFMYFILMLLLIYIIYIIKK